MPNEIIVNGFALDANSPHTLSDSELLSLIVCLSSNLERLLAETRHRARVVSLPDMKGVK